MAHLFDDSARERTALRYLLDLGEPVSGVLFRDLGLSPAFSWFLLEVPAGALLAGTDGEFDLLAGPLAWKCEADLFRRLGHQPAQFPDGHATQALHLAAMEEAALGGIAWPPVVSKLSAVEAKCLRRESHPRFMGPPGATPHEETIRKQVLRAVAFGFDRVALLDILVGEAASNENVNPWLGGLSSMQGRLQRGRDALRAALPSDSPAGHYVWPLASIAGGDELSRGAGGVMRLRPTVDNPLRSSEPAWTERRARLEASVQRVLSGLPPPRRFPAVFAWCAKCRNLHTASAAGQPVCDVPTAVP